MPELLVAIERGEIQGHAGGLSAYQNSHPDWITDKKLRVLIQIGHSPDPEMKDIPPWTDVAETEEQKQTLRLVASPTSLGRSVNTTPDVPADRLSVLRAAMEAVVKDKTFIEEGTKQNFQTDFRGHEETSRIVRDT